MFHTQNQQFSPYPLSCFLTLDQPDNTFPSPQRILKYIAKGHYFFFVLLFLLIPWQLQAASSIDERISVRVADQTKDVRERAFQRGLEKLLIRISGDGGVMGKLQRPKSRLYVQQFRYEPLESPVFDSKGELLTQMIKIRYNTKRIEQYLHENGLIVQSLEETETQSLIHLEIESVNSMTKYNRVENYLSQLSAVKSLNPLQTDGEKALFKIVLRSNEAAFTSKLNTDGRLLKIKKVKKTEEDVNGNSQPKLNAQLETSATQIQAVAISSQTIPLDRMPSSVSSSDAQTNKIPVYHYRFVR